MTKRYSGDTAVTISFVDRTDQYKASVSAHGKRKTIHVRPPRSLTEAVDSPRAYDDAARAAIAFAMDEGLDVNPEYNAAGSEIVVHRSRGSERRARLAERRVETAARYRAARSGRS